MVAVCCVTTRCDSVMLGREGRSVTTEDMAVKLTVGVRSASGEMCEGEVREEGERGVPKGVGMFTVSYPSTGEQPQLSEYTQCVC